MLQEATCFTSNPSALRRLTFAVNNRLLDTPRYWKLVTKLGFCSTATAACFENVKVYIENAKYLDKDSLIDDNTLMKELIEHDGFQGHSLGIA